MHHRTDKRAFHFQMIPSKTSDLGTAMDKIYGRTDPCDSWADVVVVITDSDSDKSNYRAIVKR